MPAIPSPANFTRLSGPSTEAGYVHPATRRKGYIPMAFQVTSPINRRTCLLPHALVMHVNPSSFAENPIKKVERIQTRGGFVEQHWGDELTEISADGSTGAFMNIYTGTSSILRQRTIAWDRYRDLLDLFYNNGSVYDPYGAIVLQGNIMLMYDKGQYIGYFTNFSVDETSDSPFTFTISWSFKVEETLFKLPVAPPKVPEPAQAQVPTSDQTITDADIERSRQWYAESRANLEQFEVTGVEEYELAAGGTSQQLEKAYEASRKSGTPLGDKLKKLPTTSQIPTKTPDTAETGTDLELVF